MDARFACTAGGARGSHASHRDALHAIEDITDASVHLARLCGVNLPTPRAHGCVEGEAAHDAPGVTMSPL